ncbi:DUF4292 domain-containing protein [Spirosoma utsteinense]|uniref:DUF4292 domain-containing protein n=1 Tax=Spirosoma utsteinense TaxID=2585773 RepID=A0ABR6W7L9_9BACT|nr:DUF4292 domain-containing protein [Spirosoma utsteinense]MBC3784936.1 hypothetical protein [Spirosoma utsteinense]MBC3792497.1 hypothetical protein [Spirosoma utsteinense]
MNKFLLYALLLSILLSSDSCRRRRLSRSVGSVPSEQGPVSSTATSPRKDSVSNARPTIPPPADSTTVRLPRPGIEEARANVAEIDFRYLTAKSKISFKSPEQDIDNANINIRVRKDSVIWLSVSKLGIEAVRGLITRDSITIIDKIHREYTVYDFPTLSKQFNFEMNFALLQALIVGNLPLPRRPAQKIKNERDYLLLRQSEGKVLVENYIGENDRKLKKLMVTEQPTKNTLRLDYEDFASLNNFLFPYTSLVTLDYKSKTDGQFYQTLLRIKHSKVELIDKSPGFPFTIPANYQRRP